MDQRKAFGMALRGYRKAKKLSQETLSAEADVDRTFISKVERGEKSPTLDTIFKLTGALGISVSILMLKMEEIMGKAHVS